MVTMFQRLTVNFFYETSISKRTMSGRFCIDIRKLEVLQCNFNALMRWLLWVDEVILVVICVFGLCGSVWTEGSQALRIFLVSVFSLSILATIWTGMGAVYETSVKALWKWRRTTGLPVHLRKFIRSTRPIRVLIGDYFYADGAMMLTLLSIITENTFNLLLAA